MKKPIIKCPRCSYKPTKIDQWICDCLNIWNTFDTAGQCPRCKKIWEDTCCPSCLKWSKHLSWYPQLCDLLESEMMSLISNKKR